MRSGMRGRVGCSGVVVASAQEVPGASGLLVPQPKGAPSPFMPTHKLLYVDDDPTLAQLVRRVFEMRGWRVDTQACPLSALDVFRAQPDGFDVVMCDHHMPTMSGMDVARQVLALRPGQLVVLISGDVSCELAQDAERLGVAEVLMKADSISALAHRVEVLLEQRGHA